uniref:EB domain-containing protein n=1 Tax=Elaeophora elaphi TaxID=1147741 RepID=A0A158Q6W9_9BILA
MCNQRQVRQVVSHAHLCSALKTTRVIAELAITAIAALHPMPAYNPIAFNGCANGGSPVGACINMRCARGYLCSPGNICCPSNDYGTVTSSTANPMKNPFLCTDGTQAAGACILGQCGSSFTCINGLCCNITSNTPRCLDGSPSAGACMFGQCGAGFVCTTGNLCCLTNTIANIIPGTCPNNAASIGICINGLCPTGHACINGQCCPQTGNVTFRCSNLNYALGPCVAGQCPDGGFQCDTTINSCCPVSDPVGPCIKPGDQCPAGNRCFKEGATPLCFKECDGRGTIFSSPVDGICPAGTSLIFGSCCTLRARFYNPMQSSFLSERYADYYPWSTSSGIRSCPDHTRPISACINGQCGYGYQCYNNVCCFPQYTNMMLSFLPATPRPIGGSCEFTQQCMSSVEGLSICELGICRCLPGAQFNGFACIRRFS